MYPLNDKYSRIHFEIPDDFDSKIYISLYPEAKKENDNQIYHFYHYNKDSYPLNPEYYRLKYNTPKDFDIQVYNNRYNFNYNEDTTYQFYKNIGQQSYPLDDTYYRLKYDIPEDFDIQVYNQRYNFNYNITNAYQFYKNIGQQSYPLDDTYYRVKYNIPNDFNLDLYKKKYNIDLSPIETYIFYSKNIHCRNLEPDNVYDIDENNTINEIININSIDENTCHVIHNYNENKNKNKNIDLHMDIEENNLNDNNIKTILKIPYDFNYETYNLRYQLNLNEIESYKYFNKNGKKYSLDETYYRIQYNVPTELTCKYLNSYKKLYPHIFKINHQIQDVFKYYSSVCKNIKDNQLENLELTNNLQKYHYIFDLIDPEVIFKDDVFFYDFIKNNVQLKHIYQTYLDNSDSELGKTFIQNYEYLENYKEYICSEESKRFYFFIREFVDEYFSKPNILIKQKSYFSTTRNIQKSRIIKKQRIKEEHDNNITKIIPNLSKHLNLLDKIENKTEIINIIDIMKKSSNPVYVEYDETEYYNEDEITFIDIKVPLYTTFYYNLENENKVYSYLDIYRKIQQSNSFYKLFIQRSQIINSFSNFTPLNYNDKYCLVTFLNDDYIHNYLSILNNLIYLGEISNLYLLVNNNVKNSENFIYYTALIQNKNIKVNLIPISNNFTFNDYNNFLFDESFWKKFNAEFIILFSTLTFINSSLLNNNNISISNNFYVSNQLYNNYNMINTLFSIRSKKCILKLLQDNYNENEFGLEYNHVDSSYKLLNINKHFEKHKFIDYINKEIPISYLEKMENFFYYLDFEYNIIDIL